jgi:AcrR family transcriptional regulator
MKAKQGHETSARHEEIIRVAARIFAAKGYHATTLDEIARELQVTKPALYYHVRNKEEILREIIGKIMEPMETAIKVGNSELPPREKLAKIVEILVRFGTERKETTLIAFEELKILPKRSRDAIRRRQKSLEEVLQKVLKEGEDQGIFQFYDLRMTAFSILASSNGVYRWYRAEGSLTPTDITERFIHFFENGYLKQ